MPETGTLKGKIGRVSCGIPPDGGGEVLLDVRGGSEAFTAYPVDHKAIPTGSTIVVVEHLSPRAVLVTPYWTQGG